MEGSDALQEILNTQIVELMSSLSVDESEMSFPVDVFVHDDVTQLLESISRRKGTQTGNLAYGEIDLLVDEDPRQRLAELVLAFGWGRSYSQVLYLGVVANAAFPDRDFHSVIAAAPDRIAPSIDDVLDAAQDGRLEETLYQLYDSPFSSRMLPGLADLRKFYGLLEGIKPPLEELIVEYTASLVQYLIEVYGYEGIRTVWGPGTSQVVLERLTGESVENLGARWIEAARSHGRDAGDFAYQQARLALEAGNVDEAYVLAQALRATDSEDILDIATRTNLATGRFGAAEEQCAEFDEPADCCALVDLFSGYRMVEENGLRILGPADADLETIFAVASQALDEVETRLGISRETWPATVSVFVYGSEEEATRGSSLIVTEPVHRSFIHTVAGDDLDIELAEQVIQYALKAEPVSSLLGRGIAVAVARPLEELEERAHTLLGSDGWVGLARVDYNIGYPASTVDTEIGYLFATLLEDRGGEVLIDLWRASARGRTLDTALLTVIGMTRESMESDLVERAWASGGGDG